MSTTLSTDPTRPFPRLHLGGTSAPQLLEDYGAAYEAVLTARATFDQIEFNSRDYLSRQGPTWQAACEWRERIAQHFADIEDYLLNHIQSIHEQNS